jgi:nitroimidazol reductase NimA-like FMN-containing flavoprotein (pyridoxamine 5'-phosphate oxidase superfamily)
MMPRLRVTGQGTLMNPIRATERTTARRRPQRGSHDRALINAILDEAIVCHVGFVVEEQPFVMPMAYARIDDRLYLHGAVSNRMLNASKHVPMCVTVTLLDGLVLARAAFHLSVNYRSVVILGAGEEVTEAGEKRAALEAIVEHMTPGRMKHVRPPSDKEVRATFVLSLAIEEASAKVRAGPPIDDEEDYALPVWAGVIPLTIEPLTPIPDPRVRADIAPPSAAAFRRGGRGTGQSRGGT